MNRLIILCLALFALLVNGASIPKTEEDISNSTEIESKRQGKTLGILTVAGSALSSGVGTAGSVLASTAKVVGGLKTLALLGIGTNFLYNKLKGPNSNLPTVQWIPTPTFNKAQNYETKSDFGLSGYNTKTVGPTRTVQLGNSWIEPGTRYVSPVTSVRYFSPTTSNRYVHSINSNRYVSPITSVRYLKPLISSAQDVDSVEVN